MTVGNKYVISGIHKSISSNLKTVVFFIPFIILIFSFVFSIILPTYNHVVFLRNGNHNYIYNLNDEQFETTGKEFPVLYYDRNIKSQPDPELDQSGYEIYYKYSKMVNLYMCREDTDIDKTMFSYKNMLKIKEYDEPNIWLSYELAKALHVGIGDSIYIRFSMVSGIEDMPLKVSGISKTKYDDEKPVKTNTIFGNAIAFFDAETFQWILDETDQGAGGRIFFSDIEIEEFNKNLMVSKEEQLNLAYEYIESNFIKAVYIMICGIVLLYIVLSFELSFTHKRHKNNMIILNMLGTPIKEIRSIFFKINAINFTVASVAAFILIKYVFMEGLLSIYTEPIVLTICFAVCLITGFVSMLIQSLKIRKL